MDDALSKLKVIIDREERLAAQAAELRARYGAPAPGRAVIEHCSTIEADEKRIVSEIAEAKKHGAREINILIDGQGGLTNALLNVLDALKSYNGTVRGVVVGSCPSASAVLFAACSERVAPPSAMFLIHACGFRKDSSEYPYTPPRYTAAALAREASRLSGTDIKLANILTRQTGRQEFAEMISGGADHWLTTAEARALNLVTKIEPADLSRHSDVGLDCLYRPQRARALAALAAIPSSQATPSYLSIDIRGEIRAGTAAGVQKQIQAAPLAKTMMVTIDSVGGDYGEAMQIYALLREHPAKTKRGRVVSGSCMSAAMLPLLACDVRVAWPQATLKIHQCEISLREHRDVRWTEFRLAEAAAQAERADVALVDLLVERTGHDRQWFIDEMATEDDLSLTDALKAGIIHEIVGVTRAPDPEWPAKARALVPGEAMGLPSHLLSKNYLAACANARAD